MSLLKVSNTMNSFIHAEKLEQIKQLKEYITENVDDDFSFSMNGDEKNLEDFCDLLDMFAEGLDKKIMKIKSIKKTTPKRKKGNTFYNYWVSKRLKELDEEQKNLDEEDRIPNKQRMKHVSPEWNAFKETSGFADEKKKWEESQQSQQSSDDESEKKPPKKPKKKAASKKKKSKVKPDTDSDSDSDDDM